MLQTTEWNVLLLSVDLHLKVTCKLIGQRKKAFKQTITIREETNKEWKRWREKAWWLTAWTSLLSVNCIDFGLCFDFLALGVRALWPLLSPPESMLPPLSSPTQPQLHSPPDRMFSLLVSALTGVALFSHRKWWENERSAFHLTLSVAHFGLSLSARHWIKMLLETKGQGHPYTSFTCTFSWS